MRPQSVTEGSERGKEHDATPHPRVTMRSSWGRVLIYQEYCIRRPLLSAAGPVCPLIPVSLVLLSLEPDAVSASGQNPVSTSHSHISVLSHCFSFEELCFWWLLRWALRTQKRLDLLISDIAINLCGSESFNLRRSFHFPLLMYFSAGCLGNPDSDSVYRISSRKSRDRSQPNRCGTP